MNRQIKFRGKRKDTGEWVYGDLLHIDGGCLIYFGSQTETDTPYIENSSPIAVELFKTEIAVVEPESVGQFTGLLDANKKEIYEGDIVKAPLLDPIFGDILSDAFCNAVIKFNNGAFVVSYYGSSCKIYIQDLHDKVEVIGNSHDTPNSLNEK